MTEILFSRKIDTDAIIAATTAMVRTDIAQSFTLAAKSQGRTNIGIVDGTAGQWYQFGGPSTDPIPTTPGALTRTNDTNVTLTLGGTPATALLFAASLTMGWTGQLAVGRGGTGLASGTSGGILFFSAGATLASSAALGANQLVLGGGAGVAPSTPVGLGTTTTVLHGNAAGAPSFAAIANADLTNSSVTYGTTTVALGASSTSIAGLTSVGLTSGSTINWNSDTFIGRRAAANFQLGAADAAAAVAQILSVQNVVTGTSNTAGANFTMNMSQGTGSGNGGAFIVQTARFGGSGTAVNAYSAQMSFDQNGTMLLTGASSGLGLGGAVPNVASVAATSSVTGTPQFFLINAAADAVSSAFLFRKNRAGADTVTSDGFMDLQAYGFNTVPVLGWRMQAIQTGAPASGVIPTKMLINTSGAAGGAAGNSLTYDDFGTLTISGLGNNHFVLGGSIFGSGGAFFTSPSVGFGYSAGAGGSITQITSRTTGVTLNKVSGAITLFAAAGSATAASFTVTNSSVGATDVIVLNVKNSGSNIYIAHVTSISAGSFIITFQTTGGTASDSPVIAFDVIKGAIT